MAQRTARVVALCAPWAVGRREVSV